jgi:hypothetical protein
LVPDPLAAEAGEGGGGARLETNAGIISGFGRPQWNLRLTLLFDKAPDGISS